VNSCEVYVVAVLYAAFLVDLRDEGRGWLAGLQLACLLVVCVVWIDSWRIFRTERRRNYIPIPLHLRTLCKYGTYT